MKPKDDLDLELRCERIEIQEHDCYLLANVHKIDTADVDVPEVYDAISIEGFLRHHRLTLAED